MIDVNTAIKELLMKHQRVILPTIGAFITQYKEAEVDNRSNTFKPPQKEITFDPTLSNSGDTLIIDFLAESSNISLTLAKDKVNKFIERTKQKLNEQQEVIFPHIGSLLMKENGQIRFIAEKDSNLLIDSFGFDAFTLEPKKIEKVPKEVQTVLKKEAPVRSSRRRRLIWIPIAALAVLVLLTGYVFFLSIKKDISFPESLQRHVVALFSPSDGQEDGKPSNQDTNPVGKALDEQTKAENALALKMMEVRINMPIVQNLSL